MLRRAALGLLFAIGLSFSATAQMCGGGNCIAPTPPTADNSGRIATTAFVQAALAGGGGSMTPLPSGQIYVGSVANVATAQAVSGAGDCTTSLSNDGVFTFTCTKTNGVAFSASATTDTTNAANITSGTLSNSRLSGVGLTANPLSQFTSTTSAQLLGIISDETGSGALVFADSPALTGAPTAPTAPNGTNTTQLATTAFVLANGAGGAVSSISNSDGSLTISPTTGAVVASNTLASGSDYLAGTNTVKSIAPSIIYPTEATTTFGTTTTFNFATFINTAVTLTGNITTMTVSNVVAGKAGSITFIQDGTGSRTTVWNTVFKFSGSVTPTLSTAPGAIDILNYNCRTTTFCQGNLAKAVQ